VVLLLLLFGPLPTVPASGGPPRGVPPRGVPSRDSPRVAFGTTGPPPRATSPRATSPRATSPRATSPRATSHRATSHRATSHPATSPRAPTPRARERNLSPRVRNSTPVVAPAPAPAVAPPVAPVVAPPDAPAVAPAVAPPDATATTPVTTQYSDSVLTPTLTMEKSIVDLLNMENGDKIARSFLFDYTPEERLKIIQNINLEQFNMLIVKITGTLGLIMIFIIGFIKDKQVQSPESDTNKYPDVNKMLINFKDKDHQDIYEKITVFLPQIISNLSDKECNDLLFNLYLGNHTNLYFNNENFRIKLDNYLLSQKITVFGEYISPKYTLIAFKYLNSNYKKTNFEEVQIEARCIIILYIFDGLNEKGQKQYLESLTKGKDKFKEIYGI
jgi:hypothetical protein